MFLSIDDNNHSSQPFKLLIFFREDSRVFHFLSKFEKLLIICHDFSLQFCPINQSWTINFNDSSSCALSTEKTSWRIKKLGSLNWFMLIFFRSVTILVESLEVLIRLIWRSRLWQRHEKTIQPFGWISVILSSLSVVECTVDGKVSKEHDVLNILECHRLFK
jgi:hypothetical protein